MFTAASMRRMFTILGTLMVIVSTGFLLGPPRPDPSYKMVSGNDYVQSKNYYLLTLFDAPGDVNRLLREDPVLARLASKKYDSLAAALKNCGRDGQCYISRMKFDENEIAAVSARLKELYKPGNLLDRLVQQHLIPSGAYYRFQNETGADMLVKAWEQDARGVNFAIGVYAAGDKPNYPLIDSISFTTKDANNNFRAAYTSLLYNAVSLATKEGKEKNLIYTTPLQFALRFIEMNEREQAADFEPMAEGENKAAFAKAKTTKWNDYKYSIILIPGAGPDDPETALSAEGMLRCRLAAILYKKGLAPFVAPSGGKVHPYKTKYCEATEMKNYLVQKLGIPQHAVIIDPHARHTTTNMRNVVRLMYRYGFPFSKPGVTCTTRGQSLMIQTTLPARCMK
jgi:hypothetical protein